MQYAYYAAYNDVRSSSYVSYMGLDTSKSLSSQTLSDTAKALLGVTDQGSLTWSQYLLIRPSPTFRHPVSPGRRR